MVCPNCKSWMPGENVYCTYCGSALRSPSHRHRSSIFLPLMVVLIGVVAAASFYLLR